MPRQVPGVGPLDARIAIIGEAPGLEEELAGKPFVGQAGRKLQDWLLAAGIRKEWCWLDNVMHTRPPRNDFKCFYEGGRPSEALVQGQERLRETLRRINPHVVLCLGNEALKALTGRSGMAKWRGSVFQTEFGKVVATYHPSYVLKYNWDVSPLCMLDVKRARVEGESREFVEPFRWEDIHVGEHYYNALAHLNAATRADYVAIDIEAPMGSRVFSHFGFAYGPDSAVSIPFCGPTGDPLWTLEEEDALWFAISKLLVGPAKKIFQNAVYDVPQLRRWNLSVENLWMDTMVAHSAVYPEIPKGLQTLTSIYTNIPYYYGLKGKGGSARDYCLYNALDCLATYRTALRLVGELERWGTSDLYFRLLHPAVKVAIQMQEKGVACDHGLRASEVERLTELMEELQGKLDASAGHPLNANSSKQVQEFLYGERGLPIRRKRSTGKPTVDEEALLALAGRHHLPELDLILQLRYIKTKLLGTYYGGKLDEDGRLHCSWNVAGTVTGRWSSSKTAWHTGLNFQNVSYFERRMFVADPGKVLVKFDYKQADTRVVAWEAGEERMKQAFRDGEDVHRLNGFMFGLKPEEVSPEERQALKKLGHGANYGIAAVTASVSWMKDLVGKGIKLRVHGVEPGKGKLFGTKEAQKALNAYFSHWGRIKFQQRLTEADLKRTRVLETSMGRKRMFFGRMHGSRGLRTIRMGYAYVPSSTVADLLNWGLVNADAALPAGAEVLMQIHDEMVVQCWERDVERVVGLGRRAMTKTLLGDMVIPVEVSVGSNWWNIKEVE